MATGITPFNIAFSPADVEDLNQRLQSARIPELIDETPWERGPPAQDIRRITNHWRSAFDWSSFQEKLNRLPNFEATVSVDGFGDCNVHFLHQKSSVSTAMPLLLIHGSLHLNLVIAMPPPITSPFAFLRFLTTHFLNLYTPQEASGLQQAQNYQTSGNGYLEIQKQRPSTIGIALEDSPVALLTWIYDKLVSWTDSYPWTDDEICEWVSIYWFSRAGPAASAVIYHDAFKGGPEPINTIVYTPGTKVGFSHFPKEISRTPNLWNRQIGDVVFEREHEHGGHFAAWEQPEALVNDLREMLVPGGAAYGAFKK
ncbi:hypothetical protein SLS62_010048 [Diatrype stigma]|uniref:Epoxide hydrolase N-terminal domain-containing protein n=1 Tax=Diatrype stigma TaxID=117547 RepID=A0AAN9UBB1_9PEZI